MVTVQEAEKIRKSLGVSEYVFSQRLGYSYSTYRLAVNRKQLSKGLSFAIAVRYGRVLSEIRS